MPPPLRDRLEELLKSPVMNNDAALSGVQPHHPTVRDIGQVLRVALWNIERGLEFDLIWRYQIQKKLNER